MTISKERLAEWERLTNEATQGPWSLCAGDLCRNECPDGDIKNCPHQCEECLITSHEDMLFIVMARTMVPQLIAELRGLRKTLHAVSDTSNKLLDDNNQLEKEADWLAWNCETLSGYNPILRQRKTKTQWREAAREACHD